ADLRQLGGDQLGQVAGLSLEERYIDIKKRSAAADTHPTAVYAHTVIRQEVMAEALMRIGEYVADNGLVGAGPYRPGRDLILRSVPDLSGAPIQEPDETATAAAIRIVPLLNSGVLAIQGPPGAGKTFTGAGMICSIVGAGGKVGVTANSHKVIRN